MESIHLPATLTLVTRVTSAGAFPANAIGSWSGEDFRQVYKTMNTNPRVGIKGALLARVFVGSDNAYYVTWPDEDRVMKAAELDTAIAIASLLPSNKGT